MAPSAWSHTLLRSRCVCPQAVNKCVTISRVVRQVNGGMEDGRVEMENRPIQSR